MVVSEGDLGIFLSGSGLLDQTKFLPGSTFWYPPCSKAVFTFRSTILCTISAISSGLCGQTVSLLNNAGVAGVLVFGVLECSPWLASLSNSFSENTRESWYATLCSEKSSSDSLTYPDVVIRENFFIRVYIVPLLWIALLRGNFSLKLLWSLGHSIVIVITTGIFKNYLPFNQCNALFNFSLFVYFGWPWQFGCQWGPLH